jgi:hypothetical protein
MTAARRLASVSLRRAGLFSLVLALIAGIFGMHVMNGHHAMHALASVTSAESTGHPHPAGTAAAHGDTERAVQALAGEEISATAGCPDGDCGGTQAMTVSCTPSGKTGTLAAPIPGTALVGARLVRAGPAGPVSGRQAYEPDTPSPCDLSISRT